jgi:hypothetical protein
MAMAGKRRSDLPIKLSEIPKLMENHTIGLDQHLAAA